MIKEYSLIIEGKKAVELTQAITKNHCFAVLQYGQIEDVDTDFVSYYGIKKQEDINAVIDELASLGFSGLKYTVYAEDYIDKYSANMIEISTGIIGAKNAVDCLAEESKTTTTKRYVVTCSNDYLQDIFPEKTFEDEYLVADYIIEYSSNIDDMYNDMLDDCYGEIEICGYSYSASKALRDVDSVAYRCGYLDFCDELQSDIRDELIRMDIGDSADFYDFTVTLVGNKEE